MNYRKVQICLDKGYKISKADISAAPVGSRMHAMLLERLPPVRLDVLAARAVRGQMMAVSGNATFGIQELLETPETPEDLWIDRPGVSDLLN